MRVWGYGRHSTDRQSLTEHAQRQQVEEYFEKELRPRGAEWGGWFYDPATSGTKPLTERPEGLKLWASAQPGDHVIWSKMDRAFRSLMDGCSVMQMFSGKQVFVHSLDLRVDTSTPLGKFFMHVLLAVAELERAYTSQRTKEAMAVKRELGEPYGRFLPMGWMRHGKKRTARYVPNYVERKLIDRIMEKRREGMSYDDLGLWVHRQKEFPLHRNWKRRTVQWAEVARRHGYPKKTYSELPQPKEGLPRRASAS